MDTYSHLLDGFLLPSLAAIVAGAILGLLFGGLKWSYKKHLAITLPVVFVSFCGALIAIRLGEARQTLVVEGVVVDDSTNKPIGQAIVSVADGKTSYISEDNGNFRLDLTGKITALEKARIHVSRNGYAPYDETVTVPAVGVEIALHHL
jgi:hypothetical protein